MKRTLFFSGFLLLLINHVKPQWNQINVGTTQPLYSVDYYNANRIAIGSFNQTVNTFNGGLNWSLVPLADTTPVLFVASAVQDIALTGSGSGIATGTFFLANMEAILRTSNAGNNWYYATQSNSVPLPRTIRSVDGNGTRMVAVGNTGRIFTSVNSGFNWTLVPSGTTAMIYDVKFSSPDTVFACGAGVVLRSVNGGITWTTQPVSGTGTQLSCKGNVVYITDTYNSNILKSTNWGVTYTTIPVPFTTAGAIHAISKDTLIMAGLDGLYISVNGGTNFEKYILPTYEVVDMIDFLNSSTGIAVGDNGYVIHTSNLLAAPSLPLANAQAAGSIYVCLGDSVNFTNLTSHLPGYTYQWFDNGNVFSTSFHAGKTLITSGTHTISMVVANGWGTDTISLQVYVTGHEINAFTVVPSEDSICAGNHLDFTIPVSEPGISYRLRNGFTNIGPAQTGTGGPLEFPTVLPLNATTTFNIKATKTTFCFVDSLIVNKPVYVYAPAANPLPACIPPDNICAGVAGILNVTIGSINNTTTNGLHNYMDYSCCKHTNLVVGNTYTISVTTSYQWGEYVRVWIDYNNDGDFANELILTGTSATTLTGTITIPSTLTLNQVLRMRVATDANSNNATSPNACYAFTCGEIEDYAVTIVPAPSQPVASFTSASAVDCFTTVNFLNTTYNGTSFTWNFGDGSPVTTATHATHVYSVNGTYTASLIACNPTSCDTVTQTIIITNPPVPLVPAACNPVISGTCFNPKPYITSVSAVQPVGVGTLPIITNSFTQDYTCDFTFYLTSDTTYLFNIGTNGATNYMVPFIDANNDGIFTPSESLFPFTQNAMNVSANGNSGWCYLNIPANAIDSVPLRMRFVMSNSFINTSFFCTGPGAMTCGDYKDFTVFIVPRNLEASFTPFPGDTVCSSDSAMVTFNNTSTGDVSWLWEFGDGDISTDENPVHYYTSYGTYTVKLTVWNVNGDIDSTVVTNAITVMPGLPVPVITANGTLLSTSAVATSYQWYFNNNPIAGATSSSYNATASGTYKVKVFTTNGCSTTSAVYNHYPAQILNVTFMNSPSICVNNWVNIICSYTNCTSFSINWGDGSTPNSWGGTGGPGHFYTTPGIYTLTIIGCGAQGCDTFSLPNAIMVSNALTISTISGNTSVCSNSVQTYSVTALTGLGTYTWTLPSGWSGTSTTNTITVTTGNTGGTISVVGQNGCGSTPAQTLNVTVNPSPTVLYNQVPGTACLNTPAFALTGGSPATGIYSGPGVSGGIFNPAIAGAGTHTITYSFTSANSCVGSATDQIIVTGSLPAPGTISGNSTVCANSTQTYTAATVAGATSYAWTLPAGWSGSSTSNSIATTAGATGGVISVVAQNNCGNSPAQTFAVTVNPVPTVAYNQNPDTVCLNEPVFALSGGSPASGVFSGPGVVANTFNAQAAGTGTHTITYTYTNSGSCTNTATDQIIVESCTEITEITEEGILFKLYPNPAKNTTQIFLSDQLLAALGNKLVVQNMWGEVVLESKLTTSLSTLNISSLPAGIYLVRLFSGGNLYTQKLTVL